MNFPAPMEKSIALNSTEKAQLVQQFHQMYYDEGGFGDGSHYETFWLGVPSYKCPLDLWIYQEIIAETQPDWIIECGTYLGGSAFFMASICDLIHHGKILTIDILPQPNRPTHPRIQYLLGSTIAPETLNTVQNIVGQSSKIMVILDSNHSEEHVSAELAHYSPLVSPGCYLIVEDTNLNGNPVYPNYGPGPMEALNAFLAQNPPFEVDTHREKFHLTFNPKGYLRRV